MANISSFALTVAIVSFLIYFFPFRKQKVTKLPPGPPQWPVIGNLPHLPPKGLPEYRHWLEHKDKYGLISSVQVMGQTMLILHDQEAVKDLLEKTSKITSSRPHMEFAHNIAGYGGYVTSQRYNDNFRLQRRFMHQQLGTKKLVAQYRSTQRVEVGHLLMRMLEEPQKLMEHLQNEAGAIILKMTYGYSVEKKRTDPLVRLVERMMANFSLAFMPLAWSVDAIPALKYLPDWLPGMSFKQTGKEWNLINQLVVNIPYSFTRQEMAMRKYQPSLVSRLVEDCSVNNPRQQLRPQDEEAIKWAAATLYGGGADTTVSSLYSFVLAMIKFPEVQRKGQEEIDKIVGQGRLPQFEDRDQLLYIEGIVQETLRWFPVTPLGVPHSTDADIEYKGYNIPEGTVLIPGIWWFLHDPQVYKDPDDFDPMRYMSPRNEPDPSNYCFGFGRRICPGRYVADSNLFLGIAQILACFNISKAVDENGKPIEPQLHHTPGLVSHPERFSYNITPRSLAHQDLIKGVAKEDYMQRGDSGKLGDILSIADVLGKS
ncbi:hypothetical protein S7711_09162 [Stachybotrys chartarum IBT 7711]|uniref:O-methylsterigmatocystin oxidoreductase n=1 Tax=Stachybotrys chartarum (strain CBS 109288 / IBT 7711) TaxID=1280523 RepID=A0A084B535_STACB|nr:hypothetical protein S7711_09162 [Stachybotrys chartarum IBT 7711]KFA55160.1 hypothetical protein S40293_09086 [Stachybotrys chartarum IBT 40293]